MSLRPNRVWRPRVSVITAVHNGADTLHRCLASVAAQNYPNLEHIAIDGASTDGTVDILKQSAGVKWISEPDRGIFDAWNKGLGLASGEWIAFLGADDVYAPGGIQAYVEAAAKDPSAEYISSRVDYSYAEGGRRILGEPWSWPRFRRYMCVAHVGSFHRRSLFARLGSYDPGYRIVGDYEFLLRAGDTLAAAFVSRVTARMDAGGASDSLVALVEAERAKVQHHAASPLRARVERWLAAAKYRTRALRSAEA